MTPEPLRVAARVGDEGERANSEEIAVAVTAAGSEWREELCPHCDARGLSIFRRVHPRLGISCVGCDERSPYRTLAEILEDPKVLEPPEVVVPRLAWRGRVTLLAAREKDGKSTVAGAAAAGTSRGAPFLDGVALAGGVVLTGLEEHVGEIAHRLVRFGADPDLLHVATYAASDPLRELQDAVESRRPALVIVDTLSAIAEGKLDDGSAKAWQPLMAALTGLARDFDCAVLIIHHARKSDGTYRDSTAIGANVDCIIEMRPDDRDLTVRHLKTRARFHAPDCSIRYTGSGYALVEPVSSEVALREAMKSYVHEHPGCALNELRKGVQGSSANIGRMADELIGEGILREEKGARHARRFYPADPPNGPVPRPVSETPEDNIG